MYTRTWALVALLAVAAVTARPAEDEQSRAGRAQSNVQPSRTGFDFVIQDAVVTELNNGKPILLPRFEPGSSIPNIEKHNDPSVISEEGNKHDKVVTPADGEDRDLPPAHHSENKPAEDDKPQKTPLSSDKVISDQSTTTPTPVPEEADIPLGRSIGSPTLADVINKQNPVIEYLTRKDPIGDASKQDINPSKGEDRIPPLRQINYRQSLLAPGLLGQQAPPTQGYYPLYYQPQYQQYPPAYSSPSNDLRVQSPYSSPYRYVATPDAHGRLSWTLSEYFPIIVHNPITYMMDTMSQLIEYGPQSDVCTPNKNLGTVDGNGIQNNRMGKALLLRDDGKGSGLKASGDTRLEVIRDAEHDESQEEGAQEAEKDKDMPTEVVMEAGVQGEGKGPFITRLLVRKGGVAIAGPGGIATAGSGGTAIVGPGGVAYARPNGLSIVGPGGKVISLPRGLAEPRSGEALPPGARVVAVGPTVYYHPAQ